MMNLVIAFFERRHFIAGKRKLLLFGQTLCDIVKQTRELRFVYIRSVESGKLARRLADAFAVIEALGIKHIRKQGAVFVKIVIIELMLCDIFRNAALKQVLTVEIAL